MPTNLFGRHFFDAETLTHNETECEWRENDAKKEIVVYDDNQCKLKAYDGEQRLHQNRRKNNQNRWRSN